jgi:hypothetical protein
MIIPMKTVQVLVLAPYTGLQVLTSRFGSMPLCGP